MLASWDSPAPLPRAGAGAAPSPPAPSGVGAPGGCTGELGPPHPPALFYINPIFRLPGSRDRSWFMLLGLPVPDSGLHAPLPTTAAAPPLSSAPSQSSSSCQWLRWEVQVRCWLPARLPCVCLVKEEASPPLESFTLSSFLLSPRLPRGFGVSLSLSVSLFSLAPIRLQCMQCSLQIPHCTLILFLCL